MASLLFFLASSALLPSALRPARPLPVAIESKARSAIRPSIRAPQPLACASEEPSLMKKVFGINRDTPEAKANQLAWARQQMEAEMPSSTLTGQAIQDREDFIVKYIASEKEKFGREISRKEAEAEIDAWLLKQATAAPSKTSTSDVVIAALVFVAAFGGGLYFSAPH